MFSYFSAVFGLKQNQQFPFSRDFSELLSRRNVIIHRHNTENNESCGWPGVHFHGLFEYYTSIGYQDDRILNQMKIYCSYFTTKDLNPFDYNLLVKKYDMEYVFFKIVIPTDLHRHLEIFLSRQHNNTSLITEDNIPRPCHFNWPRNNHDSILDLCKAFKSSSVDNYLTPSESANFVRTWCISQNVSTREFVNNWIYCLDSEIQCKNTLYFQGVNNSCPKAILNSVIDACEPLAGKVSNGTTGYKLFWKCCLGKRMIALYDPHFDTIHSKLKMLEILEGTESSIAVDDNACVTMQRTPVIIIGQEYPVDRKIQFEIKNRLIKGYNTLKSFQPPKRKLHPMWLCELAEKYYVPWRDENNISPLKAPKQEPIEQDYITQPKTPLAVFATGSELYSPDFSVREESENDSDCSELSEASSESDFMDTEETTEEAKGKSEVFSQNNNSPGLSNSNNDNNKQTKESEVCPQDNISLDPSNFNTDKKTKEIEICPQDNNSLGLSNFNIDKEQTIESEMCPRDNNSPGPSNFNIDKTNQTIESEVRPQDNNSYGPLKTNINKKKQTKQSHVRPQNNTFPDLSKFIRNKRKQTKESEVQPQDNNFPGPSNVNKKKQTKKIHVRPQNNTFPDLSKFIKYKKKQIKQSEVRHAANLQSQSINSPSSSNNHVNQKKGAVKLTLCKDGSSTKNWKVKTNKRSRKNKKASEFAYQGITSPQVPITPSLRQTSHGPGSSDATAGPSGIRGNKNARKRSSEEVPNVMNKDGKKKHPEKKNELYI